MRLRIAKGCVLVWGMLLASAWTSPVPTGKPAAYPAWWFERDVIVRTNPSNPAPSWPAAYPVSDDFAALNQGQLKHFASKAYAELQAKLPASVWSTTQGQALTAMITGWTGSTTADDYAAVNQGQLKTVAQKFYDVLALPQVGYIAGLGLPPAGWTTGAYPWSSVTTDDDSYTAANIGQAKHLFSFNVDADNDGLADSWELAHGLDPQDGGDASLDSDGDGLTNLQEYQQGSDPTDYFNGQPPTLSIVSGNNQAGLLGVTLPKPLTVRLTNSSGAVAHSGTISFVVTSSTGGSVTALATVNSQGNAQAVLTLPSSGNTDDVVTVDATATNNFGNSKVTFTATVASIPSTLGPVTATGTGSGIALAWEPGVTLESYTIQRYNTATQAWSTVGTSTSQEFSDDDSTLEKGKIYLYKVTSSSEGANSETTVQGAVVNPEDNDDTDGLTNGEEVEAGYYSKELADGTLTAGEIQLGGNPLGWVGPDPKRPDTDGDGVNDDLDGWANNKYLKPPRLPDTTYAVINLNKLGCPEDRDEDGDGYFDTTYFPYQINDAFQIIIAEIFGSSVSDSLFLDGKKSEISNMTENNFEPAFPQVGGWSWVTARILNNSGKVCGSAENHAATWTKDDGVSLLADYHSSVMDGLDYVNTGAKAYAINDNGTVAGYEWQSGSRAYQDDDWWFTESRSEQGGLHWGSPDEVGDHVSTFIDAGSASATGGNTFYIQNIGDNGISVGYYIHWYTTGTALPLNSDVGGYAIYDGTLHTFPTSDQNRPEIICINNSITEPIAFGSFYNVNYLRPYMWRKDNGVWTGHELTAGLVGHVRRVNDRFEMLGGAGLLRNGKPLSMDKMISDSWSVGISDINNLGVAIGTATKLKDDTGKAIPQSQQKTYPVALLPVDMAVDSNRDGVIKFAGNATSTDPEFQGKALDATTEQKPFRFWLNNDDDTDQGDVVPVVNPDCGDQFLAGGRRDMEDLARLHVFLGGLQEAVVAGNIKVGLKWKNTTGSPAINIFQAVEEDGGTRYLTEDAMAALQSPVDGNTQSVVNKDLSHVRVATGGAFIFHQSFWSGLSSTSMKKYLLFEGCSEGKGQLVLTFHKNDANGTEIGEGPGVWLDLKDIKKMYVRSDGNQFAGASADETDDTLVFVHGWRMSPEGRSNFAETFYKRLWHRGFKGRFAAYQWNTYYADGWQVVPFVGGAINAYLARYNDSEYNAWNAAAGLKTFVESLPGSRKHIAAHSMGNIVASEAIRLGMSVNNYALMQAAVPSACYDDNEGRIKQTTQTTHYIYTMWDNITPDDDPDPATRALAYRGRFTHSNMTNVNMVSFFLPPDYATFVPWEVNNDQTKPENGSLVTNFHYARNGAGGQKLYKYHMESIPGGQGAQQEVLDYYLQDPYEAMPYACHTWGKAQGAQNAAQGSIDNNVDLGGATFTLPGETDPGFGDEHSGQFNARIQNLKAFYDRILDEFVIRRNP